MNLNMEKFLKINWSHFSFLWWKIVPSLGYDEGRRYQKEKVGQVMELVRKSFAAFMLNPVNYSGRSRETSEFSVPYELPGAFCLLTPLYLKKNGDILFRKSWITITESTKLDFDIAIACSVTNNYRFSLDHELIDD